MNMPVIVPRPWASTSASTWWLSSSHGSAQCPCLCTSAGTTSVSYSSPQAYIMGRHQVRDTVAINGKYVSVVYFIWELSDPTYRLGSITIKTKCFKLNCLILLVKFKLISGDFLVMNMLSSILDFLLKVI